ncbi:MAG TPA: GNAT family N-acetyltransferase [Chitinophagaceae bacterium]|jgi:aminoglycoside 3-N-acetyltransferase I|nr:GNAT family N-acetyltransferase [Chitinophagaceae bacterium]
MISEITIQKVSKEDTMLINDIITHYIEDPDEGSQPATLDHIQKLVGDNRSCLFAAILNDEVVGYTLAYHFPSLYATENIGYLYDIEVREDHRKKGIGRMLVEAVTAQLEKEGVKELWLGTAIDNWAGQALFSSTGAARTDETFYDYTYYLPVSKK